MSKKSNKTSNKSQRSSSRMLAILGLAVVIVMVIGMLAPDVSDVRVTPTPTFVLIIPTVTPTATPTLRATGRRHLPSHWVRQLLQQNKPSPPAPLSKIKNKSIFERGESTRRCQRNSDHDSDQPHHSELDDHSTGDAADEMLLHQPM